MFVTVERVTAAIAKRETPGSIPNPEVKPFSADGTATGRLWESRTSPDILRRGHRSVASTHLTDSSGRDMDDKQRRRPDRRGGGGREGRGPGSRSGRVRRQDDPGRDSRAGRG